MKLFRSDGILKGKITEKKFREWLNKRKIAYLYIQQDKKTFSKILKSEYNSKRPDFFIMLPHIGSIFVDVKYKKLNKVFHSFPIDQDELRKYSFFQRYFHIPIWYAISNEDSNYKIWYWIPVSRILNGLDKKEIISFISPKSKMLFLTIPKKYFIILDQTQPLHNLFKEV